MRHHQSFQILNRAGPKQSRYLLSRAKPQFFSLKDLDLQIYSRRRLPKREVSSPKIPIRTSRHFCMRRQPRSDQENFFQIRNGINGKSEINNFISQSPQQRLSQTPKHIFLKRKSKRTFNKREQKEVQSSQRVLSSWYEESD